MNFNALFKLCIEDAIVAEYRKDGVDPFDLPETRKLFEVLRKMNSVPAYAILGDYENNLAFFVHDIGDNPISATLTIENAKLLRDALTSVLGRMKYP